MFTESLLGKRNSFGFKYGNVPKKDYQAKSIYQLDNLYMNKGNLKCGTV
jgi:hypothetical protein